MTDSLLNAYLPLFFWVGVGMLLCRWLPDRFPQFLGRSLYWVGVPLEIFALARQAHWSDPIALAPLLTGFAILSGLLVAGMVLQGLRHWSPSPFVSSAEPPSRPSSQLQSDGSACGMLPVLPTWEDRPRQGSFLLASMFGNTGFVGLAIAPAFVSDPYLGWLVLYSVTQNVLGTYGIGVFLASYFGRDNASPGWIQLRDVLTVPSLWAFMLGSLTQSIPLPPLWESGLQSSIWVVIPTALVLMGIRLSQLQGWQSLRLGIPPSLIKGVILPIWVGGAATMLHLLPEARLALVLMAGMPTAFAGLILAEEYGLDRELIASSIVLSSGLLVLTIPLWLLLF